jgi:hypothetical protein
MARRFLGDDAEGNLHRLQDVRRGHRQDSCQLIGDSRITGPLPDAAIRPALSGGPRSAAAASASGMVSGGVKAVEMPSPVPTMNYKYTFTDVMIES